MHSNVQKWEYIFLSCQTRDDNWVVTSINGQDPPSKYKGISMYILSQALGAEGWELVSSHTSASTTGVPGQDASTTSTIIRLIFKRPK
jgi:hypothetical protein